MFNTTRTTPHDWACVRVVDGVDEIVSGHQRQDKAVTAALAAKLNDPEGTYEVVSGRWRVNIEDTLLQIFAAFNQKPREGETAPTSGPSTPQLGQPAAIGANQIDVPLAQPSTAEETPVTYDLQFSTTGETSGFTELASGTDIFDEDGYSHTNLDPETQYWYRVRAIDNALSTSPYSAVVTQITEAEDEEAEPAGAPSNVTINTVGETTLENITWDAGQDATSYRVIVATASGDGNPSPGVIVIDTTTTQTSYPVVSGLDEEQWYYVRVCSINAAGQGGCANRVYAETLGDPGEEPPVSGNIIVGPLSHENEPLNSSGYAPAVSGVWNHSASPYPSTPLGDSFSRIANSDPLWGNSKYFQTCVDKDAGQQRSERAQGGNSSNVYRIATSTYPDLIQTSGIEMYTEYTFWFGYLMRVDRADDGPKGFIQQWHGPTGIDASHSPHHGIRGMTDCIRVYWRERATNSPPGSASYTNNYGPKMLTNSWEGTTHAYVWKIRWDGRTSGNQGIFEMYLDDNPTPIFVKNGERNLIYGHAECIAARGQLELPFFKWGNYGSGSHTGLYIQSHDMLTVMEGDGDLRESMLDAIKFDEIN